MRWMLNKAGGDRYLVTALEGGAVSREGETCWGYRLSDHLVAEDGK